MIPRGRVTKTGKKDETAVHPTDHKTEEKRNVWDRIKN